MINLDCTWVYCQEFEIPITLSPTTARAKPSNYHQLQFFWLPWDLQYRNFIILNPYGRSNASWDHSQKLTTSSRFTSVLTMLILKGIMSDYDSNDACVVREWSEWVNEIARNWEALVVLTTFGWNEKAFNKNICGLYEVIWITNCALE